MRIVSTVPSQTELLYHLGLEDEVIGITKFCVHPNKWWQTKTKVGGTKKLNIALIKSLQPDWIIANKEENTKEDIEALAAFTNVYVSDVYDLHSAYEMMRQIGRVPQKIQVAASLITSIQQQFKAISLQNFTPKKVAYLIWNNPIMTVGKDTFIHEMIAANNWTNAFDHKNRYPESTIEELKRLNLDYLLLSTEPFPFKEEHLHYFQSHLPHTKVIIVDGEYFSWYGSRLMEAPNYFIQLQKSL